MGTYLVSFAIGAAVGVAYGLLNVRSPAPPVIALVGLLGMLCGERTVAHFRDRVRTTQAVADQATEPERATP
jgi:XapX domain-containing protein